MKVLVLYNTCLILMRYENCNKCRMDLGVVGGTAVSHIKGNLVDLETDLMGITRKASLCPTKNLYQIVQQEIWQIANRRNITIQGDTCGKQRVIDTTPLHLQSCNMIRYKPNPLPPKLDLTNCGNRVNMNTL